MNWHRNQKEPDNFLTDSQLSKVTVTLVQHS